MYLDFIHPLWINVNRSNKVEDELVLELSRKLNEKLEANRNKLYDEFRSLNEKNNIEE